MNRRLFVPLLVGLLVGLAGEAWAIVGADTGSLWVQSSSRDKISLANIISFELGDDPQMYLNCLDKTFQDPANIGKTIIEAAKECKAKKQP